MQAKRLILTKHEAVAAAKGELRQVRRAVRGRPSPAYELQYFDESPTYSPSGGAGWYWQDAWSTRKAKPLGSPGDRVWGAETFFRYTEPDWIGYRADARMIRWQDGKEIERDAMLCYHSKQCPSPQMPRWASRHEWAIAKVRVERAQEISEEDAIACGYSQHASHEAFDRARGKLAYSEACWVEDEDGDASDGYLCRTCAEALCEKHPGSSVGIDYSPVSDGPAYCDKCNTPLYMHLTAYGVERELLLEGDVGKNAKHYAVSGMDAAIAAHLSDRHCSDLGGKHLGRLAQMGFATAWDSTNPAHPWSSNPPTWVYDLAPADAAEGGR